MTAIIAFSFFLLAPFVTFLLLWLKGIPSFAVPHPFIFMNWVYSVTWLPALFSGVILARIVTGVIRKTESFHRPYDFGRCFSLGAIAGALTEAAVTWLYRTVSHRPFSDFWIAGALIAGCIAGATITSLALWRLSESQVKSLLKHKS